MFFLVDTSVPDCFEVVDDEETGKTKFFDTCADATQWANKNLKSFLIESSY